MNRKHYDIITAFIVGIAFAIITCILLFLLIRPITITCDILPCSKESTIHQAVEEKTENVSNTEGWDVPESAKIIHSEKKPRYEIYNGNDETTKIIYDTWYIYKFE